MIADVAELKQTERLFIAVRLVAVPVVLVLGWLHPPLPFPVAIALSAVMAVTSAGGWYWNRRASAVRSYQLIGAVMLALDALIAMTAIAFFLGDRTTAAYAGFGLVVIEAAVRYALPGGLAMAAVFAAGFGAAMVLRSDIYAIPFSWPGYVFWTLFMVMLAIAIGLLVRQNQRRQEEVRSLGADRARLEERHRLSRELHDSLLKTLHGLALEAHSLQSLSQDRRETVKTKARYIEEVCTKAALDIRDLIFDLRQDLQAPLSDWASRIVERWGERTGIAVAVHQEQADVTLPPRLAHDLRQALEEALLNVERHAQASRVEATLKVGAALVLELRDNGKSAFEIEPNGPQPGVGLLSMKERVEQWGGTLAFGRDDGGFRLSLSIPWPPRAAVPEGTRG